MPEPARELCVILGAGGHGRVVLDCLLESGAARCRGFVDLDPALKGSRIYDKPVLGGDELLAGLAGQGVTRFVVGLAGTGAGSGVGALRRELFERAGSMGLLPLTLVHPAAAVSARAEVGPGTVILAGAVVGPGARLGANVVVNNGVMVEHDCRVEDHCHLATGSRVCGGCRVGRETHVGAGAVIKQQLTIGRGAVIGLGAAVISDVPAGAVVAGVPARELKRGEA